MKNAIKSPNKAYWDGLYQTFCTLAFIESDPVRFAHRFATSDDWRNSECAGFIAALMSYGRRDKILEAVEHILEPLGPEPIVGLSALNARQLKRAYKGFYYRFHSSRDVLFLIQRLAEVYATHGSLKDLWAKANPATKPVDLRTAIFQFRQAFLYGGAVQTPETYGSKFWFANPMQNSAAKRFNMFLRWMVRQDAVDLGYWQDVLSPAQLLFPLDTHVATQARHFNITQRQANDWRTAEDITDYFRQHAPDDPVRYDFALFGLGISS